MQKTMQKVLIVEDDEAMCDMLHVFVSKMVAKSQCPRPMLIMLARHGRRAWEIISDGAHDFDLVITDYEMPEMTGVELVVRIREKHPDMPVILMSGREEPDDHQADAFLGKPFGLDDLAGTIQRLRPRAKHTQGSSRQGAR